MNNPAQSPQLETNLDSRNRVIEKAANFRRVGRDTCDNPYATRVSASHPSAIGGVTPSVACDSAGSIRRKSFPLDLPDVGFLRECLDYAPQTGRLLWKERPASHFQTERSAKSWNTRFAGKPAFTRRSKGVKSYRGCVTIDGEARYLEADRVAWILHRGQAPQALLRFRNGDRSDIRITNLEAVSAHDVQIAIPRKSRFLAGAYLDRDGKWYSNIRTDGRQKRLGTFGSEAEANAAWLAARAKREARIQAAHLPNVFD